MHYHGWIFNDRNSGLFSLKRYVFYFKRKGDVHTHDATITSLLIHYLFAKKGAENAKVQEKLNVFIRKNT